MVPSFIMDPVHESALPVTVIAPPFIPLPRCMPASPSTIMLPIDILAPIFRTLLTSPQIRMVNSSNEESVSCFILKRSSRVRFRFPSQICNVAISLADFSAKMSGLMHSASTGTLNRRFGYNIIIILNLCLN